MSDKLQFVDDRQAKAPIRCRLPAAGSTKQNAGTRVRNFSGWNDRQAKAYRTLWTGVPKALIISCFGYQLGTPGSSETKVCTQHYRVLTKNNAPQLTAKFHLEEG